MFLTDYQSVYGFIIDVKNLPFLRRFHRYTHHDLNAVGNQPPQQCTSTKPITMEQQPQPPTNQ